MPRRRKAHPDYRLIFFLGSLLIGLILFMQFINSIAPPPVYKYPLKTKLSASLPSVHDIRTTTSKQEINDQKFVSRKHEEEKDGETKSENQEHMIKDQFTENTNAKENASNVKQKLRHNVDIADHIRKFQLQTSVPMTVNKKQALLYGKVRNYQGFLTIGIPSVLREGISYLEDTLDSLISGISLEERSEVTVVVLLADRENEIVASRAKILSKLYQPHIKSGFIQIVHPHKQFYPNFDELPITMEDTRNRMIWRSKQNIDFAYLCMFSENISQFYIQLEDDVISRSGFVKKIKNAVEEHSLKSQWFVISFAKIGFIGRLIESKHLRTMGNFLLLFYAEQPGDLLFNYLRLLKTQSKEIFERPSLFQHIGVVSSMSGKIQDHIDKNFGGTFDLMSKRKQFHIHNPKAEIFTTIHHHHHKGNMPEFAYDRSDKYFVGHSPNVYDNFTVNFITPQNINKIYIKTGLRQTGNDFIQKADVYISSLDGSPARCTVLKRLGSLATGVFNRTSNIPRNITCLVIVIKQKQSEWVTVKEIAIFTSDNYKDKILQ